MTLIIAEAGVNHNGDINLAYRLIEAAAESGADIVKFQTFNAFDLATANAEKASYQRLNTNQSESQLSMLRKLELPYEFHNDLISYSQKCGIEFLSSPFDLSSIQLLTRLGITRWKIPSGEITNVPLLRAIGAKCDTIILSTGMSSLSDVEFALNILEIAGTPRSKITLLHCTTEYPAPTNEVNLLAMKTLSQAFDISVGYSDHTLGILVPVAAVAMGASVIEKHLTLDTALPGPDHKASLDPHSFSKMVQAIRSIESAMGDGIKRPTISEVQNMSVARKSLVAKTDIQIGDYFTEDNMTTKRPGSGVSPKFWDIFLGKRASMAYQKDDLLQW